MNLAHVLFVVFFGVVHAGDFRLSDSKLLLPYYSFSPINFTLRGSNGACYEWQSGTPEVATVVPLSKSHCSTEALVTAVWQSQHRAVTTIYARVTATGHVVKCDVIVDNIQRIEIETTTQELYLHNTPESLNVVAYDEYGNTFSTLDGVPLEWRIHGDTYSGAMDGHSVLRFLTWTESEYATPKSISVLEARGLQGHMQLVSGLRTGSAVVSTSLLEPVYTKVPAAHVRLLVMANAQLSPPLAYLMPFGRMQLHVRVVQQGSDKDIQMPSSQYHLQVNDSQVATLDSVDGCTVTALLYGQTEITLLDRNVEEALDNVKSVIREEPPKDDLLRLPRRRLPTSLVHVVEPAYLGFTMKPLIQRSSICHLAASAISMPSFDSRVSRNWMMEVGQQYVVLIDIYDQNSHRLYPTDNLRLKLNVPVDKLRMLHSTINGTVVILQPLAPGVISLEAKLAGLIDKAGKVIPGSSSVLGTQEIVILEPVQIQTPSIVLPWPMDHAATPSGYPLVATGGNGQYLWVALAYDATLTDSPEGVTEQTVVQLSRNGTILPLVIGQATVVALSPTHPQLCGSAKVIVAPPSAIKFTTGPSEVVVGVRDATVGESSTSLLTVGLAVLDSNGRAMTDCRGLDIHIEPVDGSVLRVLPERFVGSTSLPDKREFRECLRFHVVGLEIGFTELEATYQWPVTSHDEKNNTSPRSLTARFPVAVYRKVILMDPSLDTTLVALGSTRTILFSRGPQPWPLEPSNHFVRIQPASFGEKSLKSNALFPTVVQEPRLFDGRSLTPAMAPNDVAKMRPMQFRIRCEEIGTFRFTLAIGNRPWSLNPVPIVMNTDFTVVCDIPSKLRLSLHPPIPGPVEDLSVSCTLANTTTMDSSNEFPLPNTAATLISLAFLGSDDTKFDAVDSMLTTVSLLQAGASKSHRLAGNIVANTSPKVIRQFSDDNVGALHRQNPTIPLGDPYFTIEPLIPGESIGTVVIRVESRLPSNLAPRDPVLAQRFVLDSSIRSVRFIPPVHLLPTSNLRLFHQQNAKQVISLVGGSEHFHLIHSDDASDRVLHIEDTGDTLTTTSTPTSQSTESNYRVPHRDLSIQSRRTGITELRIIDLCYPASQPISKTSHQLAYKPAEAKLSVEVIGLSALRLYVVDRLQLSEQTVAIVEALDTNGQLLPADFTQLLELRIHEQQTNSVKKSDTWVLGLPSDAVRPSVAYWSSNRGGDFAVGRAQFVVRGLALGSATLSVSTSTAGVSAPLQPGLDLPATTTVRSNTVEIQVFSPLRLSPCNFNLLIGAERQLRATGGPHPASVEFHVDSGSIPNLILHQQSEQSGARVLVRATGLPGPVTVRARAVSRSKVSVKGSPVGSSAYSPLATDSVTSETTCTIHVVQLSAIRIGCPLASVTDLAHTSRFNSDGASPVTQDSKSDSLNPDDRFLLACPEQPGSISRGCGVAPLWTEGMAFTTPYATNASIHDMVTPLDMASVQPPLRFVWRLSPPQLGSVARLTNALDAFDVHSAETDNVAGMNLVGLDSGRVTVHLTVIATDPSLSQLVDSHGNRLEQLHTQLTVHIMPPMTLLSPWLRQPRQLLMSPNSEFQLRLWSDILSNSQVSYELLPDADAKSNSTHASEIHISQTGLLRVGPSGSDSLQSRTLRVRSWPNVYGRPSSTKTGGISSPVEQSVLLDVVVRSPRFVRLTAAPGVYARPTSTVAAVVGLPVGGPYEMHVTYHDDLGRAFDAVSTKYQQLQSRLHRDDLFDAELSHQFRSPLGLDDLVRNNNHHIVDHGRSTLRLRSLPVPDREQRIASAAPKHDTVVLRLMTPILEDEEGEESMTLWPIYISLLHGGELNALGGQSSMTVGEWRCLPALIPGARWSSSNPAVLWVDPHNNDDSHELALARSTGRAYLIYTPNVETTTTTTNYPPHAPQQQRGKPTSHQHARPPPVTQHSNSSHLRYMVRLEVMPLAGADSTIHPRAQLIPLDNEDRGNSQTTDTIYFPIVDELQTTSRRFALRINPEMTRRSRSDYQSSCALPDDATSKRLTSVAPIHCSVRLALSTETTDKLSTTSSPTTSIRRSSPTWLSVLLLWYLSHRTNDTLHIHESTHSSLTSAFSLSHLVKVELEPSTTVEGATSGGFEQWHCVLQRRPPSQSTSITPSPLVGLSLLPHTRLVLEVNADSRGDRSTGTGAGSGGMEDNQLATLSLVPLPGFEFVIPPPRLAHMQSIGDSYAYNPIWIHNPNRLTHHLLIFLPAATTVALGLPHNEHAGLVARSKSPHLLDFTGPARPASGLVEIAQIIRDYAQASATVQATRTTDADATMHQWTAMAVAQVQQIENEAAVASSTESGERGLVGENLLWVLELRAASLGTKAVDTTVEVVISLRQTGQHVTVPIHLLLPAKSDQYGHPVGSNTNEGDGGLVPLGFSWLHFGALILITLLVTAIVHIVVRSANLISSSTGVWTDSSKNMPAPVGPHSSPRSRAASGGPRMLWIQGGAGSGFASGYSSSQQQQLSDTSPNWLSRKSFSPSAGDQHSWQPSSYLTGGGPGAMDGGGGDLSATEQRWRGALATGGSPSRLRDTFDSI